MVYGRSLVVGGGICGGRRPGRLDPLRPALRRPFHPFGQLAHRAGQSLHGRRRGGRCGCDLPRKPLSASAPPRVHPTNRPLPVVFLLPLLGVLRRAQSRLFRPRVFHGTRQTGDAAEVGPEFVQGTNAILPVGVSLGPPQLPGKAFDGPARTGPPRSDRRQRGRRKGLLQGLPNRCPDPCARLPRTRLCPR